MTFLDNRSGNNESFIKDENPNNNIEDNSSSKVTESLEKIDSDIDDDIPF